MFVAFDDPLRSFELGDWASIVGSVDPDFLRLLDDFQSWVELDLLRLVIKPVVDPKLDGFHFCEEGQVSFWGLPWEMYLG